MFEYTKADLNIMSTEMNFVRDTLEKVIRLVGILDFINSDADMKGKLILKGGTAINLFVFDLPRLSVDIDLDFSDNCVRDEMVSQRNRIAEKLRSYFDREDYSLSAKSKSYHSLDSFVVNYINSGEMKDNIKIEINYSLRSHLFAPNLKKVDMKNLKSKTEIAVMNRFELFAAKINALLSRAMPRDLYDVTNMVEHKIFNEDDIVLLRSSFVLYTVLSQEEVPESYSLEALNSITLKSAMTALLPVLHKGTHIDIEKYKDSVRPFLLELIDLTEQQKEFLSMFNQKIYKPELLFSDKNILERIASHPMIVWKLSSDKNAKLPVKTRM